MNTLWLNRLGIWNPQLLREFRGRLTTRNVIAAIGLSAIAQVLLILLFAQDQDVAATSRWMALWRTMTWIFPYFLFTVGSFYIVSDISQEEQRGTLNFIRLSPRPAWQILLGKLLGVPILPLLMVGFAIPLHIVAAIAAGISLPLMISLYGLLLVGCGACYSAALLAGLVGGSYSGFLSRQGTAAIGFAAIAFLFGSPLFMYWNLFVTWQPFPETQELFQIGAGVGPLPWFYLPLNQNLGISHGFTLAVLFSSIYLIWRIVLRRFRKPRSPLLSKRQSYALLAYLEVLGLGAVVQLDSPNSSDRVGFFFMYSLTFLLVLALTFSICPRRQALLDWVRYQPQGLSSWIWSDKSPAILAVVIQLAIANGLLLPWALLTPSEQKNFLAIVLFVLAISAVLLMYGLFIQLVFAAKVRNPSVWALGGLGVWSSAIPFLLGLLQLVPTQIAATTILWTFLGYPFWHFVNPSFTPYTMMGIGLQAIAIAFLGWRFRQTLKQLRAGG